MQSSEEDRAHAPRPVSRAPIAVVVFGLLLALVLVLLGARQAAEPAPPPDLSQPGTLSNPRQVNVILRDYAFNPDPLHLVAGETVRFNLVNGGLVEHEFVLGERGFQEAWARAYAAATPPGAFATLPPVQADEPSGGVRVLVASGASASVNYHVPDEAVLELVCHLPGHIERGMVAAVEVADP